MDPIELNDSPDLTMEQITKMLFNSRFLSDIEFHIENKVIYAHSWELMKRSVVFQKQLLTTLGDKKLLPIVDTSYQAFYQLLRFIYNDEYSVEPGIDIELIKLARKYKISRLETKLLNERIPPATSLELIQLCTVDKYTLAANHSRELLTNSLGLVLQCENFIDCHPEVVQEVLKIDSIPENVTELDLFDALVRWMNQSCAINEIPLAQRRLNFDIFLRLIRFGAMTQNQFDSCVAENCNLFTMQEIRQKYIENHKSRQQYMQPWDCREYSLDDRWATKFTVSKKLILSGVRYGYGTKCDEHVIQIFARNLDTDDRLQSRVFRFQNDSSNFAYLTRSLGSSIRVRPNFEYTVQFSYYMENSQCIQMYTRWANLNVLISGVEDAAVDISESSTNLFELIFAVPAANE